jgi:hypothetical protein
VFEIKATITRTRVFDKWTSGTSSIRLCGQTVQLPAPGAETGSLRFRTGAYRFWRTHVRMLAATAEIPQSEAMADVLLAPLAPEVYQHMRGEGLSRRQIADAVGRLATLLN